MYHSNQSQLVFIPALRLVKTVPSNDCLPLAIVDCYVLLQPAHFGFLATEAPYPIFQPREPLENAVILPEVKTRICLKSIFYTSIRLGKVSPYRIWKMMIIFL